ncbi:MAG: anti-sigma factor [Vicinamibacterales bacterium]
MTCRELTDFILDYLGGDLPAAAREHFERHLTACTNCHEYLHQYEAAVAAGRRAFTCAGDEIPDTIPEDLVRAILAARKASATDADAGEE